METNQFSDNATKTLNLAPLTPSYATIAFALVSRIAGTIGAWVDDNGMVSQAFGTSVVAAAGSTVADAALLPAANVARISSDGAAKGVRLRPTTTGRPIVEIINTTATACELYANTGGTVNGLSANASVIIPASKGVRCFCTAADTWLVFDMPAAATAS